MNANNVFIGTVAELADKLFAEFDGAWARERIYFSPSEDVIASDITDGDLSLVFSDTQYFDGSYLNYDGVFHTGCVYQLIFAAVYKDGEDTVSFAPNVEGEWAAWEAYWLEHEPDNNLQLYAAVMLLEGESLSYGAGGLTGLENTANKVTSIDGDSTDEQYPSAKCLYDTIGAVAPKIQKYTINAAEYYGKTSEDIVNVSARAAAEGLIDATVTVSVKLVDDAFDNPTPVFSNQPITYEGGISSPFVYADLKEIVLLFESESENEDTGEMELVEFYLNASFFVRMFDDNLNASIKFEINEDQLSATISARYEGIDNNMVLDISEAAEMYNEILKAATLCYVPYEKGDETIAEVSI